jgi:hypothetical protein
VRFGLLATEVVDFNQGRILRTDGSTVRINRASKFAEGTAVLLEPLFPSADLQKIVSEGRTNPLRLVPPTGWWSPDIAGALEGAAQQQAAAAAAETAAAAAATSAAATAAATAAAAQRGTQLQQVQQLQLQQLQLQQQQQTEQLRQQQLQQQQQQQQQILQTLPAVQPQTTGGQQQQTQQEAAAAAQIAELQRQIQQQQQQLQALQHTSHMLQPPPGMQGFAPATPVMLPPAPSVGAKRSLASVFGATPVVTARVATAWDTPGTSTISLPMVTGGSTGSLPGTPGAGPGLPLPLPLSAQLNAGEQTRPTAVRAVQDKALKEALELMEAAHKNVGESGIPFNPLNPASLIGDTAHLGAEGRLLRLERDNRRALPKTVEGYFQEADDALLYNQYLDGEQRPMLQRLNRKRARAVQDEVKNMGLTATQEEEFVKDMHFEHSIDQKDPVMKPTLEIMRKMREEQRKAALKNRSASAPPSTYGPNPPPPPNSFVPVAARICHWCSKPGHEVAACADRLAGKPRTNKGAGHAGGAI